MTVGFEEPIDLEALKRAADSEEGSDAVVSRAWLKRAYLEIAAGRKADEALGQVFARQKL
ncbi:MAG: hypothetical protein AAF650_04815 [Pseudomonadota bacterium]